MRPWGVLLSIITGSCVAIAVALAMTGIVFLFLGEQAAAQVHAESRPLLAGIACSWALSAVGGLALYGELRGRPWRAWPQALLLAALALLAWIYWPK